MNKTTSQEKAIMAKVGDSGHFYKKGSGRGGYLLKEKVSGIIQKITPERISVKHLDGISHIKHDKFIKS